MISLAFLALASNVAALTRMKQTKTMGYVERGVISAYSRVGRSKKQMSLSANETYQWMLDHLPATLTNDTANPLFLEHAQEAWKSRYSTNTSERLPWTAEYDDEMFLENVVPITHFDEEPEEWMKVMKEHLLANLPQVNMGVPQEAILGKDVNPESPRIDVNDRSNLREVAQAVVENVWTAFGEPKIEFKANQTPGVLSPLSDVLVKRYGSCTAMSIFLADALRSMGVPARVVGVAVWARTEGGNHNWVEAWFNQKWNFIDAVPGVTWWNTGWFTEDGTAQKSTPDSMTQIATPVWNTEKATTQYHVTWSKDEGKWANEEGPAMVVMNLPAIDRTLDYKKIEPNGGNEPVAQRAGSRLAATLSVLSVVAVMLSL